MRWRAWYADGSTVSSAESCWADLPRYGLVVLKLWPDRGPKRMYCGLDAIWWDGSRVYQLDVPPTLVAWAKREGVEGRLKFGVHTEGYERIHTEALAAKG